MTRKNQKSQNGSYQIGDLIKAVIRTLHIGIEIKVMLKKSDYKYFKKAKYIAMVSDFEKIHIGCVAVYHGNIIGFGCNTNKTHPVQKYYNKFRKPDGEETYIVSVPKLHAEINCLNQLRHLDINYAKVKLYIYRKRNDRPYGMCRPCESCMAAIRDLGIRDIYYTTNDGFVHERLENIKERGIA